MRELVASDYPYSTFQVEKYPSVYGALTTGLDFAIGVQINFQLELLFNESFGFESIFDSFALYPNRTSLPTKPTSSETWLLSMLIGPPLSLQSHNYATRGPPIAERAPSKPVNLASPTPFGSCIHQILSFHRLSPTILRIKLYESYHRMYHLIFITSSKKAT